MSPRYYLKKSYYLMKSWGPELMSNIYVCRRNRLSKSKSHNNSRFHHYKEYSAVFAVTLSPHALQRRRAGNQCRVANTFFKISTVIGAVIMWNLYLVTIF